MSELKPCPFCGGKAITSTFFDWDDLDYMDFEVNDNESIDGDVTCENERCINGWYLSPKNWNTRPIEDELRARIAELETEKECEMRVFKDGNAWCFVLPDFQDLQVSSSVWMKEGALDKIYKELRSVRNGIDLL